MTLKPALFVFTDRVQDVVDHVPFLTERLDLGLGHVDLRPLDVPLVAVVERDRRRHAQGPRIGALNAEVRVVLERVGLIEQVDVRVGVGLGELDFSLGSEHAEPDGLEVGPVLKTLLDERLLRHGKISDDADRVSYVDRLKVLQRNVQHQRQRLVGLELRLFRLADLELGTFEVGLDRQQV